MANNNFFLGNSDPLLGGNNQYFHTDTEQQLAMLKEQERRLMAQLQNNGSQQPVQQQQSQSPIWDEIDKEFDSLTSMQQRALAENDDYKDAYTHVQEILNREFLKIMRPIVESTPDGHNALNRQLSVIKKEKKFIVEDTERKLREFEEWQAEQARLKRQNQQQ